MSLLRIRSLTKRFGNQTVLDGIDLDVEEGETYALMGSSGGGKTTLLRCVSGLVAATEGDVEVDGVSVVAEPERARRSMGMVFQSSALFDFMTVAQNVRFGLERVRDPAPSAELDADTESALEHVGLAGQGDKTPDELSGGMRKRVGIARALVLRPKLMLYDEPTTGLDPITTYQIDELIAYLRREDRLTSVLVSHDLRSVQRTATRVGFLDGGALVFSGTPAEFLRSEHPAIRELVEKSQADALPA